MFFSQARRLRKTLGGGMRQIGVLCAAAYVALRDNVVKLEDDHRKAKIFAGLFYVPLLLIPANCIINIQFI